MKTMPDMLPKARVWVYMADRPLTSAEQEELHRSAAAFLGGWTSHNEPLSAGYELRDGLFFVLAVDDSRVRPGGCSIDSSVHFIRELESRLHVRFMNRMLFAYASPEGPRVRRLQDLEELVASGEIGDATGVYNTLVATRHELEHQWLVPYRDSWQKKMNPQAV
jgi:hypothetical protein